MTGLVLYDDIVARGFAPFSLTRPLSEVRVGAALMRGRWTRALGRSATGFISSPHLADFVEFDAPPAVTGVLAPGTWIVNARCAVNLTAQGLPKDAAVLFCDDRVAAIRLAAPLESSKLASGEFALDALATGARENIDGWWLDAPWDLIGHLQAMLIADTHAMLPAAASDAAGMTVVGGHPAHVESGARIEPMVIADTTLGPVLVRARAHVQAFTRLVGPCVIGEDSTVMGGKISGCSIGPFVKLAGEMSSTIMIGHANKGHDGFVGHSVIGRWANLGAGTITSNLKNSYGEVSMWTPAGKRGTGLQFLGSLIGDHAKTGIGTRLSTGSVIGAAANVFGTRMPPTLVAPFAWGDGEPWETFDLPRFLVVAARVMARRGVDLPARGHDYWTAVFAARGAA
jgi:UDP-N-acetylglucosamine diphosphorylase / glucose-1-phosphate thymidylyltransferase / UDP-N-acetylgalactosamine diphosphorylase / glucosamine-1-phosphate N-acetyltransferase / galactosamine-1-phosphate N-acetyltransferase